MSLRARVAAAATAAAALLLTALHGGAHAAPTTCPPTATAPSAAQVQAGMKAARDRGFLWRLRKDGRESWLYGTVHVARLEWTFPGPAVSAALQASDTIALELDLLDPDIQRRLAQAMAAPGAPIPAALRQRLQRQAEAECLPAQALERLGPELQVATLESLVGRREGLDPSYGIDAVLAGWARGAGKPVVSLETPERQLAALTMPTPAETVEFVDSTLTEIETGRATPALRRVAQVWADGDLERLTRYEAWCDCVKTLTDRAALTRLLDGRNPALADAVVALHGRGQRVFAAVGSLHMIGATGLPALLARRGFEVETIAFARR
jgi:hypothetical protein